MIYHYQIGDVSDTVAGQSHITNHRLVGSLDIANQDAKRNTSGD